MLHLCTKNVLDNNTPICSSVLETKGGAINVFVFIGDFSVVDVFLDVGGADVATVFSSNVCPFAAALPLDVANTSMYGLWKRQRRISWQAQAATLCCCPGHVRRVLLSLVMRSSKEAV